MSFSVDFFKPQAVQHWSSVIVDTEPRRFLSSYITENFDVVGIEALGTAFEAFEMFVGGVLGAAANLGIAFGIE